MSFRVQRVAALPPTEYKSLDGASELDRVRPVTMTAARRAAKRPMVAHGKTVRWGCAPVSLVILALLTAPAGAQSTQTRIYGPDGKSVGTITEDGMSNRRYRGADGRTLGTSSTDNQGTTRFYGPDGRLIGTERK